MRLGNGVEATARKGLPVVNVFLGDGTACVVNALSASGVKPMNELIDPTDDFRYKRLHLHQLLLVFH